MKDIEQRTSKMKKILLLTLGCLTMISAASAQTGAQKAVDKKLAKYNQTGEFVNCIRRNMIKKMVVVDDTKILFELKGNKAMLNTLDKKCTGLAMFRQFSFGVQNNRVCDTDIITTRQSAICNLSDFEVLEEKS